MILGTGLKSKMLEGIRVLETKLGGKLMNEFSSEVTHVVAIPDKSNRIKRTIKYMLGVLAGCWVVSYDCGLSSDCE